MTTDPVVRRWTPSWLVSIGGTLGGLGRGGGDPAYHRAPDGAVWRTTRTPHGVATQRISSAGGVVESQSWGPGADWVAARLDVLLGIQDDVSGFDPTLHPLVAEQWRRRGSGMRTPRTESVLESLVAAVLEQRVTGIEARRSWRWLLTTYGEPAPGPAPEHMRVFPAPTVVASVPSWEWHRAGVDGSRAATVARAVSYAGRLEECVRMEPAAARARMEAIPGIGVWTSAEVAARALGDADAVSYGDFHIAKNVVYALTGETDGTDERLAQLLEPWAGPRGRVVRLVELTGISRPARGPRYSPLDFRDR